MKKLLLLLVLLLFLPAIDVNAAEGYTIVVPMQYEEVSRFVDGIAKVRFKAEDGTSMIGTIDKTGALLSSEPGYNAKIVTTSEEYSEGLKTARIGDGGFTGNDYTYGYVNEAGALVIDYQFNQARKFSLGLAAVQIGGKWGYIDKTGSLVIPCQYSYAFEFSEGLAMVRRADTYDTLYIDMQGNELFEARGVSEFKEGLTYVDDNGKFGYIDKTGKLVIPCVFESATNFNEGLAAVKMDGKWGFISSPHTITYTGTTTPQTAAPAKPATTMQAVSVSINFMGGAVSLEKPVFNKNGKTMYPLRECLETLGAKIHWDPNTKTATATLNDKSVAFTVDAGTYKANGQTVSLEKDAIPFNHEGSVYIPVREAAEALGFSVSWDQETQTVRIQ